MLMTFFDYTSESRTENATKFRKFDNAKVTVWLVAVVLSGAFWTALYRLVF